MYISLKGLLDLLECNTKEKCYIDEVFWDFGAGMKHVTILRYSRSLDRFYQLLNPSQAKLGLEGMLPLSEAKKIVEKVQKEEAI